MGKRVTPEEDVDRLAERIWSFSGRTITDRGSFNEVFDDYMGDMTKKQKTTLKNKTFDKLRKKHGGVVSGVKKRISKRKAQALLRKGEAERYSHVGREKGRIVYAREDTYQYRGRSFRVYRDKKGRFVSVKKARK